MRKNRERLLDILEAIERIEKHTSGGKQEFAGSDLIQAYVIHHLQIIGEAARSVSPEFKKNHPEISWSEIIGTRNILVHAYFDIDLDITWLVVEKDLPILKEQVKAILDEFS